MKLSAENSKRAKVIVNVLVIIAMAGAMGYMAGFHQATGSFPLERHDSILPPSDVAMISSGNATDTVSVLRDKEYEPGYNCLDYAWEAMRLLHWEGQMAMVVRLDLEPDPDHAVVIVPTEDKGWVFIEPQTGKEIWPKTGGKYVNFVDIAGVYVMSLIWIPIEEYITDVADGTLDGDSYYGDNGE